jgi:hypothetical protein
MKNHILLFIFFCFTIKTSNGQSISLNDLVRAIDMTEDEFDSFAISKGYEYYKLENNEFGRKTAYKFKSKIPSYFTQSVYSNGVSVTYQTFNLAIYSNFKSVIKQAGYKYIETTQIDGAIALVYNKDNIFISLISGPTSDKETTVYEISANNWWVPGLH